MTGASCRGGMAMSIDWVRRKHDKRLERIRFGVGPVEWDSVVADAVWDGMSMKEVASKVGTSWQKVSAANKRHHIRIDQMTARMRSKSHQRLMGGD